MRTFLWFLQQCEAASAGFLQHSVCFVMKEPQSRLCDFLSHILSKKFSKKLERSSIVEELEALRYDQTAQMGLFGAPEVADISVQQPCWLDGVLVPGESASFLTQAQKNTQLAQLSDILTKSLNKTYFFEMSFKDFDGSKAFFEDHPQVISVKIPDILSFEDFSLCAQLWVFSSAIPLQELFGLRLEMQLDHAFVLFDHASSVSRRTWEAFKEYAFGLLSSSSQLRDLSESFWTRNSKRFFNEWRRVGPEYPETFWVAYWSTQLWLAYFYIDRAHHVDKITPTGQEHGLSPWFTWKSGWKKYSKAYCEALHARLYEIDLELKNGSDGQVLEYLFNQHFLGN